jgi:uncharacterized protein (DUF362 family)
MPELSRRDLLKLAALGLGAVALDGIVGACKSLTAPSGGLASLTARATSSATPTPTMPPPSATPIATPTPAPSVVPDLVVARAGEPEPLVRAAVAALGGMERFVKPGASVIVKPNVCVAYRTYEYAATTNPWVVATLVKMALEAGAGSVRVMDYPYGGDAATAYAKSGIAEQVKAAGGEMTVMTSRHYVSTAIPSGKWMKKADVYEDILEADVLINAPIAKVHGSARVTAGMKNLMGVVRDRPGMHASLGQAIADLHTRIKPDLTVVDCVRILTSHGPSGGKISYVKKLDTVLAGIDIVAIDSYVATLFGLKPSDLAYVKIGQSMGLGSSDLSSLRIQEIAV